MDEKIACKWPAMEAGPPAGAPEEMASDAAFPICENRKVVQWNACASKRKTKLNFGEFFQIPSIYSILTRLAGENDEFDLSSNEDNNNL